MVEGRPEAKRHRRRKGLFKRPWFIVLLAAISIASGFYIFTGWRARDLAAKARQNFESGNYRMAWLQLRSARDLRPGDAEVLRAGAIIESRLGRPEAMETISALEEKGALRAEDIEVKADIAMRFGTDEEFEEAVRNLEELGGKENAAPLRANRAALRGDLDRAIIEARRAVEISGSPELRLKLARLLNKRHGHALRALGQPAPEDIPAFEEMTAVIDGLQSTELSEVALALGLGTLSADQAAKRRWAAAGIKNVSASNPALLPAAEFLVRDGSASAEDLHTKIRPFYDGADLAQRADFALWLSRQGMAREALSLITAQEASDDLSAFLARTNALAQLAKWQEVLGMTETASKVPDTVRHLTRVWAVLNWKDELAQTPALTQAVGAALQSAAREKQLRPMVASLESIGAEEMVDSELEVLCSNPEAADEAFSLLRQRRTRSEGTDAIRDAYERAKVAAPAAPSVLDHARYLELFGSLRLDSDQTSAAIAAQPSEVAPRVTHALLMLRRNDPSAAKATFDDVTVFFDQMTPSQQVVVAAYTAGTGDLELAQRMRGVINTNVLTRGELSLLDKWVSPTRPN